MENQYPDRIVHLLQLYLLGDITEEERQELEDWCEEAPRNRKLFEQICQEDLFSKERFVYEKIDDTKALRTFEKHVRKVSARGFGRWWKYAAVLLFPILVVGSWKLIYEVEQVPVVTTSVSQIQPGCSRAVLVLDDGRKVFLKEEDERVISEDKGITVTGEKDRLVYTSSEGKNVDEIRFNELEVPRGGEYKVRLADGTLVYLNSATRMKYPVKFDEKERKVYLSGEAYFDVTKNDKQPFIVETDLGEVKVYGTQFNVKFYPEEKEIKATLVEGNIGFKSEEVAELKIKPGYQLRLAEGAKKPEVKPVKIYNEIAWKNRMFCFESERLESIMLKLERWYNVDIIFEDSGLKKFKFSGNLNRYDNIDKILHFFEEVFDVKFAVEENTIKVMRK